AGDRGGAALPLDQVVRVAFLGREVAPEPKPWLGGSVLVVPVFAGHTGGEVSCVFGHFFEHASCSIIPCRGGFKALFLATGGGSFNFFVWGWKRPRSMPATYAPGPRSNDRKYTNRFWACQDQNTRYLVAIGHEAPHVGGLPVDIPGEELGTAWVTPVGNQAKLAYRAVSSRARLKGSWEASFAPVSVIWTLCVAE